MSAKLIVLCGKPASGKSTLSAKLVAHPGRILIAEDDWLSALFGAEMSSLQDYVRYAAQLRAVMGAHVVQILQTGTSVVLDFQANTLESRTWMRDLGKAAAVPVELHFLDISDAECKARLKARNASGTHQFTLTEAQFDVAFCDARSWRRL